MFANILVPLDGSAVAEQALSYARDVCRGKLLLLRVQNYPSPLDFPLATQSLLEAEDQAAHAYLEGIHQRLTREGALVSWIHRVGDPASTILQEARDARIDLIVMASHGRSGLSHFLLGSITEKVVRHATCPVLVVRQPDPA
ncbi:universal stress protein [bacterium]|nr:universal stress protein [bacterium]